MTPGTPFEPASLSALERAVSEVEARTSAELVLVLAHRSAREHVPNLAWGGIFGLVMLGFILVCPWEVAPELVIPDVCAAFVVGLVLSMQLPRMQRVFIPAGRLEKAVSDAAKLAFFDHAVSATKARTGILVFYSDRERDLAILPDLAIQAKVAGHQFNTIVAAFRASTAPVPEALATAIGAIGAAVTGPFPRAADDVDELPNAPRVQA
jgi:putative membrane protein